MLPDDVLVLPGPFATAVEESLVCFEADDEVEALFLGDSLASEEPGVRRRDGDFVASTMDALGQAGARRDSHP